MKLLIAILFSLTAHAQCVLSWSGTGGKYIVQRSFDSVKWATIGTTDSTSFPVVSNYYYRVIASNRDTSETILVANTLPVILHDVKMKKVTYK